jgi:hypothetical protein
VIIYSQLIISIMKLKKMFAIMAMLMIVFTIGCKKDDLPGVPPTVNSTYPINDASGTDIRSNFTATFSTAMDPSSITVRSFTVMQGDVTIYGVTSYSDSTAKFDPREDLAANTLYTATITTGVKNVAGEMMLENFTWSFTTGALPDVTSPTVTLTNPLNNATGVAVNKAVVFTFSEAIDPLTINATTFTLKQGTSSVTGAITYTGTTATFTPSVELAGNTLYTAAISTGAKDLVGNALADITAVSFTTVAVTSNLAVVNLGAAGNYVILAKSAVNNNPTSAVTGDIGLSPAATSFMTGFSLTNATGYATSTQVTGNLYAADMAAPTGINLTTAVENMITAYNDAAGRPTPDFSELGTGNIGGKTLTRGLYKWTNTVTLPTSITISGSANDVWIFQIAGDLTVSSAVNVILTGGAQAKNIFWQVAGQVTVGTTSHFEGIILSMTGITLQTGSSMNGRALAQTAVILDGSTVVKPQ